ncbi:MAG: hydroxyisourate hydrolase [Myxococcales bacterium]|nr:hydroxyisourate hydrolase [Myxococcota bacterium]MDW8283054.1 hydroxyisourate hydrolase [Myxococcales bacterium]
MSNITTHVLDTSRGKPAGGVAVVLLRRSPGGELIEIGRGETDGDGRLRTLLPPGEALQPAVYLLRFDTGSYFRRHGIEGFYPEVSVVFMVQDPEQHYHVPLLLSPFGYSTYRGS